MVKSLSQTSVGLTSRHCSSGFIPLPPGVKLLLRKAHPRLFFDLLSEGARDLQCDPFQRRRQKLESLLPRVLPLLHLTTATYEVDVASDWFSRFEGAGLDGIMASPFSAIYEPDRRVVFKVKHERDCDCVVAGLRWQKNSDGTAVGSLLLGLFDDSGILQQVGACASFTQEKRREL
jgi:ATP-dependent DNA ligase